MTWLTLGQHYFLGPVCVVNFKPVDISTDRVYCGRRGLRFGSRNRILVSNPPPPPHFEFFESHEKDSLDADTLRPVHNMTQRDATQRRTRR